jgi:hypothetical protein
LIKLTFNKMKIYSKITIPATLNFSRFFK